MTNNCEYTSMLHCFRNTPGSRFNFSGTIEREKIGKIDLAIRFCSVHGGEFGIFGTAAKALIANLSSQEIGSVWYDGDTFAATSKCMRNIRTMYSGANIIESLRDVDILSGNSQHCIKKRQNYYHIDAPREGIDEIICDDDTTYFGGQKQTVSRGEESVDIDIWSAYNHVFGLMRDNTVHGSDEGDVDLCMNMRESGYGTHVSIDDFCMKAIVNFPFNIDGYYVTLNTFKIDRNSPAIKVNGGVLMRACLESEYKEDIVSGSGIPIAFNTSPSQLWDASINAATFEYIIGGIAKNLARAYAKISGGGYAVSQSLIDFYCLATGFVSSRFLPFDKAVRFCHMAGLVNTFDRVVEMTFAKRGHDCNIREFHEFFKSYKDFM